MEQPTLENIKAAYEAVDENGKKILCALYPELLSQTSKRALSDRPVMERVKTFDDACHELGETHPLVQALNLFEKNMGENANSMPDVLAFLKLRIVAAALNEGWTPDWNDKQQCKWYPWFYIYSEEEYNNLSEEDKCRVVGRAAMRMRLAVSFARARTTFLRSRTRATARVSPSNQMNLPNTAVSSLANCGRCSTSAEIIITGPAVGAAGLFLKQSYIGMENEIKAQSIKMPKLSDKEFEETIQLAIKTYGKEAQTQMLFEEMAELQNALCKLARGRGTAGDVCEEIADVMIMCLQMAQIYGPKAVEQMAQYKMRRLKNRLINPKNYETEKAAQVAWKSFLKINTPPGMSAPKIHPLFASGYNMGVAEALSSQWKDLKTEIPEDEQQVLVETDCEYKGLRYAIAYYLAGAWHFPDDWYYDCRVLRWLYIPCAKGGKDGNQ